MNNIELDNIEWKKNIDSNLFVPEYMKQCLKDTTLTILNDETIMLVFNNEELFNLAYFTLKEDLRESVNKIFLNSGMNLNTIVLKCKNSYTNRVLVNPYHNIMDIPIKELEKELVNEIQKYIKSIDIENITHNKYRELEKILNMLHNFFYERSNYDVLNRNINILLKKYNTRCFITNDREFRKITDCKYIPVDIQCNRCGIRCTDNNKKIQIAYIDSYTIEKEMRIEARCMYGKFLQYVKKDKKFLDNKMTSNIVPIETMYKGVKFRSRLEARWAVFFDACGIEWVYEPEGFEVGNGLRYLPDFLLFNVHGRNGNDRTETDDSTNNIYVEVKGKGDEKSYKKINAFVFEDGTLLEDEDELPFGMERVKNPLLILGYPPNKDDLWGIIDWVCNYNENVERCFLDYFSFHTIDGDNYPAIPCISKKRRFELVGPDYIEKIDVERTLKAYQIAKSARFEYGETPNIKKV